MVRKENPRLFSYVVARDYGFAPNPFFGICTLATCKPKIRATASIGDWIIGTGSSKNGRQGYLVFAMRVTETMTFNEYWEDERFQRKKPNMRGSMKQAFGDNIYFMDDDGHWQQQDSHHSYANGSANPHNICNDTKANRILCSTDYVYWGRSGPKLPQKFRTYNEYDICCASQGHKCRLPNDLVNGFVAWFRSLKENGCLDAPLEWRTL